MSATRRDVLLASLAMSAVGGFAGAAFARTGSNLGIVIVEDGVASSAREALIAMAAGEWRISEIVAIPHREFVDHGALHRRLRVPGLIHVASLLRSANHLLCRETVRDAGGAIVFDGPASAAAGFNLLVAVCGMRA